MNSQHNAQVTWSCSQIEGLLSDADRLAKYSGKAAATLFDCARVIRELLAANAQAAKFSELSKAAPEADAGKAHRVKEHQTIEPLGVIAPTVSDVAIDQGWTGNTDIDAALLMLDRMDVSPDDDARVDAISATLRKLAAQVADVANVPDALSGNSHAGGTEAYLATEHHNERGNECRGMMLESVLAANKQGAEAELSAPMWTVAGKGVWLREQIDEYVRALLAKPDALLTRDQAIEKCAK